MVFIDFYIMRITKIFAVQIALLAAGTVVQGKENIFKEKNLKEEYRCGETISIELNPGEVVLINFENK